MAAWYLLYLRFQELVGSQQVWEPLGEWGRHNAANVLFSSLGGNEVPYPAGAISAEMISLLLPLEQDLRTLASCHTWNWSLGW